MFSFFGGDGLCRYGGWRQEERSRPEDNHEPLAARRALTDIMDVPQLRILSVGGCSSSTGKPSTGMPSSLHSYMSSASKPLFELQQVEVRMESERAAVQSITRTLKGSPEIDAARKRITSLDQEKAAAATQLRELERQADDLAVAIKRHNSTLFGGNIHDVREMASIEAEIHHAKSKQSALEDREIELLEKLETVDRQLRVAGARLEELTAGREQSLGGLRSEKTAHERALVELEAKHEQLAAALDPPTLARYERLQARLGHAVAQVTEGACSACRIQLPEMDAQHAHGNTIATCPNCGRILYGE